MNFVKHAMQARYVLWTSEEQIKISKFQPYSLAMFPDELITAGKILWVGARIGGR